MSKDENLTKSHVRYLESRLIKLAQDAHRAKLTNDTAPDPIKLPEPDVADMEAFLAEVQMILPVLGLDFTQPKPTSAAAKPAKESSPIFVLNKVGASARAQEIDGQFVVFFGSTARRQGVPSWKSYKALREKLVADNSLVEGDDPTCLVFSEDVAFNSPSAAASVVMARASNGRKNWQLEATGQTYADWQDAKLAALGADAAAADDEDDDDQAES